MAGFHQELSTLIQIDGSDRPERSFNIPRELNRKKLFIAN